MILTMSFLLWVMLKNKQWKSKFLIQQVPFPCQHLSQHFNHLKILAYVYAHLCQIREIIIAYPNLSILFDHTIIYANLVFVLKCVHRKSKANYESQSRRNRKCFCPSRNWWHPQL
jgi:hypothetical protein